jgi:hypothetical protein
MDSVAIVKSVILELQELLVKLESALPSNPPTILKKPERHSPDSFLAYGKKVADDEGWANGCRFPRKSWPLREDGKEYGKLQDLAAALKCKYEKGTLGSEIYLHFG